MLACVDVDYRDEGAVAACLLFGAWTDAVERRAFVTRIAEVAPYVPGSFYQRELPCILQVLALVDVELRTIVIDGYVFLDEAGTPGLGAHLHLATRVPVIGVAKTAFRGSSHAARVLRGKSTKPLYVTAVGIDAHEAAGSIRSMHGAHRVPTLLARVDRLCRQRPPSIV
jgi:deoxyribonuclease V